MLEFVNKDKVIYYSSDDKDGAYIKLTSNKHVIPSYKYDIKGNIDKTILEEKSIIDCYYYYSKGDIRLFDKLQFCIESLVAS